MGGLSTLRARKAHKHLDVAKHESRHNGGLFNVNEKAFYAVLCHACKRRGLVFGKLSAIDVFKAQTALAKENGLRKYRKMDYRVFDFVVCDPVNLSIIALITCHGSGANNNKKNRNHSELNASEKQAWGELGVRVLTCNHNEKNMLALRNNIFN